MKLLNIQSKQKNQIKEKTIFNEMRYILDAKDNVYQQKIKKNT